MGGSIAAVICAAGLSSRMGGIKKEYLPLLQGDKTNTVLGAAVAAFVSCPQIGPIVITVPPGSDRSRSEAIACLPEDLRSLVPGPGESASAFSGAGRGRILLVDGGSTRRASVHNALSLLEAYSPSCVLIHDGARPWITRELIERVIDAVLRHGAVIPALPLIETPKELCRPLEPGVAAGPGLHRDEPVFITRHLKRAQLCTAQTPQGFRFPEILRAHEQARERETREQIEYTDDAEVWGEFIGQVAVIPGDPENKKITYPEDLR
ncbi:MAG: 2-C-methyl-D-erythritol 4-phosphate cytidylyltransferase [Treponema sp.]|nr:2-C-methyl-D-erythritol 4-phosphate cytidylyltransferase [Treponema sp.]